MLNTAFGYGVYAVLVWFGFGPRLASLIALVAGILFNFQSVGRLVFRRDGRGRFVWFVAVYAVVYAVNLAALEVFFALGAGPYLAQALALPVIAVSSYELNKRWVFERGGAPMR
jgi:putative flippase GtrA